MDYVKSYIMNLLEPYDLGGFKVKIVNYGIKMLVMGIALLIITLILNKIILRILSGIILKNKYRWDNVLIERKIIKRIFYLVPGVLLFIFAPVFGALSGGIRRIVSTYVLIITTFVISSCLDGIDDIYRNFPISKIHPIKGLLQVIKIIVFIIFGIVIVANLMEKDPIILLSSIGAIAAVFSFVFKDSILGFIAGIQLTSNDMLRIGDWIEMSKYGADGEVIDITLNTVKVQNFDKSIITLPAYSLVSDSFRNWRGMMEGGGRRIKRSIYIDMESIHLCTSEMIERFKKINLIKDYVHEKEFEFKIYNQQIVDADLHFINGRNMTNIGTFRVYIQSYIKNHPDLDHNQSQIVRQLSPHENGIPLEIYTFTKTTNFHEYETIQADIFDHILSVVGIFDLRIYQNPTGYDMKQISFDRMEIREMGKNRIE